MKKNNMQLNEIKNILNCKNHTSEKLLVREISHCYCADLMSDVLKSCKIGSLLITGLVNLQLIQVAEIMDLKGIIFVSGKIPNKDLVAKAEEKNLPLLTTEKQMFDTCGILYSFRLRGKEIYNGTGNTVQSVVPN